MEVFLTSPWIPPEWVKAHGLEPRAITFAPGYGSDGFPLGAGICAFSQEAVRFAEQQTGSLIVFTTHCDQLRRTFDSLAAGAQPHAFLFNLPVVCRSPASQRIFRAELERLGNFCIKAGGHAPSRDGAFHCLETYRVGRAKLRDAARVYSHRTYVDCLARFHNDGLAELPQGVCAQIKPNGVRLAVIGGPVIGEQTGLWDQIENAGGCVVLDGTEWGERSLGAPASAPIFAVADEVSALLDVLSRNFVESCVDAFQRPNHRLYDWLRDGVADRAVQGIILWHYYGCDLWRAEAQTIREKFRLPLLLLEADESGCGAERNANRINAFVEALK